MQGHLARIGLTVFAMLFAIALVTEHQAAGHQIAGRALVATVAVADVPAAIPAMFVMDGPVAVAGFQAIPPALEPAAALETPVAVAPAAPAAPVVAAPAPPPVAVIAPAPPPAAAAAAASPDGIVLASWYGPGFYGNRTACGQVYTPEIVGVAHKTLPCGTLLTLTYGSRVLTVPVIDRGPYIAGRTLDLSNATKLAIGCTDLCTLRMQILR
jgi:hypothetical protein